MSTRQHTTTCEAEHPEREATKAVEAKWGRGGEVETIAVCDDCLDSWNDEWVESVSEL